MSLGNKMPDKTLQANVQRRLSQKCSGNAKIQAVVRGGDVTISGVIKHEHERRPILRCLTAVQGIGRVIDQLTLEPKKPSVFPTMS